MVKTVSRTAKYARRREAILRVASALINSHGTRGMTLTAVAEQLGLDTSSITYYFKRKEDLAAACLAQALTWQHDAVQRAGALATPRERVRALIGEHFALHRRQIDPAAPQLALLNDMGALPRAVRAGLEDLAEQVVAEVRRFFDVAGQPTDPTRSTIATVVLLSTLYTMPAWINRHLPGDFDRLETRLFDLFEHGLAPDKQGPVRFDVLSEDDGTNPALLRFLHAATDLINRDGYVGASVERIAGEIGLSTGSFYHHLNTKNDLVVACFDRSFHILDLASHRAQAASDNAGSRSRRMCATLFAFQFASATPLLRISAFQALPPALRDQTMDRTFQYLQRISGMISDAIAEGTMRAVDPSIACYAIMASIDAASSLRSWAQGRPLDEAVELYCTALDRGIF
jgi:AcrR family transcriptional regulator